MVPPVDVVPLAAADVALADELFAAVGQLRRHAQRLGGGPFPSEPLSGAQVELVRIVRRHPGLSVAEAAAALALAPNTVSTLVGQLVAADVMTRESDPQDRRVARLTLTPSAQERVVRWRDRRASATAAAISELEASDRATLARAIPLIASLAASLGAAAGVPSDEDDEARHE